MRTKIQKWGNSQGLRLPKVLLDEIQTNVGDEVKVYSQEGKIIVEPVTQIRSKFSLQALVKKIPKTHKTEEINWGNPVGKEGW